jgi:hypothetical protein
VRVDLKTDLLLPNVLVNIIQYALSAALMADGTKLYLLDTEQLIATHKEAVSVSGQVIPPLLVGYAQAGSEVHRAAMRALETKGGGGGGSGGSSSS